MSKGKARTPYEFGSKVGIATTLRGNLIVGARALDGNPYDGHTLAEQIKHRGKKTRLAAPEINTLKRRQAIEPVIGHLKSDHRLARCHLKGALGDKPHALPCAAGYNIRWLLRAIRATGLRALLRLLRAMAPITSWSKQRLGFAWHRP